jgi:hypothetical protein
MTKYTVTYGYRTDDGMSYSMPTHHGSVVVEVECVALARHDAIDAAYQKHGDRCSHVTIESVTADDDDREQEARIEQMMMHGCD